MRKSINVETVTSALVNTYRAKLWRGKVEELVKSVAVASTDYVNGYQQKLKGEIEFANANLELLSEEDYKWLLEQQKSPTVDSTESKRSLSIDSLEFKKALASAPFVCKTHCDSEEPPIVKKPVDSTVKKVRKPKKVYLIQDKKTKQYVTKVDHSNFTEVDLDKDISEARLYTSMGNADSDCKYLSRYKDPNCKAQLEVVEMPDDEKFVLRVRNGASWSYFIKYHPISTLLTDNLDEATRYNSEKSSLHMEKKLDRRTYYRFTNAKVKDCVEPELEKPVTKAQVRARKPKVKEEWVLYINGMNGVPWYYVAPTNKVTPLLRNATSYPSYAKAANANYNLIKAGEKSFIVEERKNCK